MKLEIVNWFLLLIVALNGCVSTTQQTASTPSVAAAGTAGPPALQLSETGFLWRQWDVAQPVRQIRIMALYFKLADDQFRAEGPAYSDSLRCLVQQWPVDSSAPKWMGELLVERPFDPAAAHAELDRKPNSITAFFYHMSGGRLWLYGREVAYAGPPIRRARNKRQWRENNRRVLSWLIRSYDLRELDNDGDGFVDWILFINRARPKFPYGRARSGHYQGVANGDYLPSPVIIADPDDPDEPVIRGSMDARKNSGTYQTDCYAMSMRNIILHEIGHKLLGGGHRNRLQRWNLMAGSGGAASLENGVVLSAWEKMKLGWLRPIVIRRDTLGVELGDLTATNQAVKIPVSGGYFLLEYRKNHLYFEIPYEPECPMSHGLGEGLLISRATGMGEPDILPANARAFREARRRRARVPARLFPYAGRDAVTPYTTPNTHMRRHRRTGLAITDIREQDSRVRFNVFLKYYEGRLPRRTVWQGVVTVGKTVVVPENGELIIRPGTRVRFLARSGLDVRGVLRAVGRAEQPIVFEPLLARTWAGIRFVGPAASAGRLDQVVLRGAEIAIAREQGAEPTILTIRRETP